MSQPIGTALLVFNSKGQILLGKRKNSYKAGYYGAPGGRLEVGEKILDCAKRELKEETGIDATELQYLGFVKENQGEWDFIHFICTVNIVDQLPECTEPDKCEGWEWFDLDKLPEQVIAGHLGGMELLKTKKNFVEI